jgi:hypothetical protein
MKLANKFLIAICAAFIVISGQIKNTFNKEILNLSQIIQFVTIFQLFLYAYDFHTIILSFFFILSHRLTLDSHLDLLYN